MYSSLSPGAGVASVRGRGAPWLIYLVSLQLAKDLLHPCPDEERRKHKLKRLVQSPNSYFMDVKCPGEYWGWVGGWVGG